MIETAVLLGWIGTLSAKLSDLVKQRHAEESKEEQAQRKKKLAELETVSVLLGGNYRELVDRYVEPDCQLRNPADYDVEDKRIRKTLFKETIERFLQASFPLNQKGRNQMVILADAGMGKTAGLCITKMLHITGELAEDLLEKDVILRRISVDTLSDLKSVELPHNTILLLDALDEDRSIPGNSFEKVLAILEKTDSFFRVILTCRTQFFPKIDEPSIARKGMVKIGATRDGEEPDARMLNLRFMSYFDSKKVENYLCNVFPDDKGNQENAKSIIGKMKSLECRPLLLSYIEDVLGHDDIEGQDELSEYDVYTRLLDEWLLREKAKKNIKASTQQLRHACQILACEMFKQEKVRQISTEELEKLRSKSNTLRELHRIDEMSLEGRSLLNRNNLRTTGDYVFAHFTIQEFLLAERMLKDDRWNESLPGSIELTPFTCDLLASQIKNISMFESIWARTGNLKSRANMFSSKEFNDPRFSPDIWYLPDDEMLGFVRVPAGVFLMGSKDSDKEASDGEKPQHKVKLSEYYIARYPVTVAQYRPFNEDRRTEVDDDCGVKQARRYNHPVESVSWTKAVKYCAWLTGKLRECRNLPEAFHDLVVNRGYIIALPTEAEWEKAARGTDGKSYPWGNSIDGKKANYDEIGLKETSPVGCFPEGASPYGCMDMAGNVWEWCHDEWEACPYRHRVDGIEDPGYDERLSDWTKGLVNMVGRNRDRVMRGGSWCSSARVCRSAFRNWVGGSDGRIGFHGFRVCLVPGPLEDKTE